MSEKNIPPPPGMRKEEILIRVRKSMLAELFGVSKWTIDSWIKKRIINIRNLSSICDFYYARKLKTERKDHVHSNQEQSDCDLQRS